MLAEECKGFLRAKTTDDAVDRILADLERGTHVVIEFGQYRHPKLLRPESRSGQCQGLAQGIGPAGLFSAGIRPCRRVKFFFQQLQQGHLAVVRKVHRDLEVGTVG